MAITNLDVSTTLSLGAGVVSFDPWDDEGNPTGYIDLGEPDTVDLTVAQGTTTTRLSRRRVERPTIFSQTSQGQRSIAISSLSVSVDVIRLFLSAVKSTYAQAAVAVTDEVIFSGEIEYGRQYQLGASADNPVGIMGASSVTIGSARSDIAAWQATTAYLKGEQVEKVTDDGTVWTATNAGVSGATQPTWPTVGIGDVVVDGTIVWKHTANAQETFTLDVDYELALDANEGAKLQWISPDTFPQALVANYTPLVNSRTRLQTGSGTSLIGTVRFVADAEIPVFCKQLVAYKCELIPNGNLGMVTDENTLQQVGFTANVLDVDGVAQITADGRAI